MERLSELDVTPAYGVSEAARYLHLAPAKVRRWAAALCTRQDESPFPLTFANLLELHVLKSMRLTHALPLQRIRRALSTLRETFPSPFPLLERHFITDGLDILIEEQDSIINLSRFGQRGIKAVVEMYAQRIEFGTDFPRLFPFIRSDVVSEPKSVVITPHISFGRPTITGTGISTEVIADRFAARESLVSLAAEYRLPVEVVEDAIRWEMTQADAA